MIQVTGRRRRGSIVVLTEASATSRPVFQTIAPVVVYAPVASGLRLEPLSNSQNAVLATWSGPPGRPYRIYLDGALVDRTNATSAIVPFPSDAEDHIVEVILGDAPPTTYLIPASRARLVWTRPPADDPESYRIFWNAGSGAVDFATPLDDVPANGQWGFAWLSPRLDDDVEYLFVVRPVDDAGNEGTSIVETSVKLRTLPQPVLDLDASYDPATKKITITGE